jgi:hypothetical protein
VEAHEFAFGLKKKGFQRVSTLFPRAVGEPL